MIASIETMKNLSVGNLSGVFFDIDGTFTARGKICVPAFSALWIMREKGLRVVAITGRPAGWCDHIARMWPVDGVVGENGAFYFWYDAEEGRLEKRFLDTDDERRAKRQRLMSVRDEILASIKGAAVASDQAYREADLAIDYCEDVAPLGVKDVEKMCAIFKKHGGTCKVSSIHVNGWFGEYDKLKMTKLFAKERWGIDLDDERDRYLFCGDSPNDEPMFRYFPNSVGVKNVLAFAGRMKYLPAFVTRGEEGDGFAEMVEIVTRNR